MDAEKERNDSLHVPLLTEKRVFENVKWMCILSSPGPQIIILPSLLWERQGNEEWSFSLNRRKNIRARIAALGSF